MKVNRWMAITALAGALLLSGTAKADTLSATTTDFGSVYTLTVTCNATNTLCDVTLRIDTTGTSAPGATNISAVDFKISSTVNSVGGFTPPSGTWTDFVNVGINNAGCASGGNGFVCAQASTIGSAVALGGIFTWTWTGVSIPSLSLNDVHIGAKYNNSTGTLNGVITSNTVTLSAPEPTTLGLLFLSLLGVGGVALRRRQS